VFAFRVVGGMITEIEILSEPGAVSALAVELV